MELPKVYNPQDYEDKIYKKWEKSGYFNPDNLDLPKNAKQYTIVLPPPNITDKLHMGHASTIAIEDLMIRYHRMKGYKTLWVPGTDHASIATQNVVEKKLLKEKGLSRHDLGKEKFLKEVWKFVRQTQAVILKQTKKMGASLDWSREAFTLDEQRKKAVSQMFVDMYNEGLIYRGERIVNWCPRCQSTLADDEVEYKKQKSNLYFFKYNKNFPFIIATTRPETKLGDTAVAVNPKDKRYKKYIGKIYKVNFCGIDLSLKIIPDCKVDMKFGTGALGVTPAHSMVDWQMAEKNNLKIIKVIDEQGKIYQGFGEYSGKTVEEARKIIVQELQSNSLLEKQEEIQNNLSICYRCSTPIEPLPSKQWFVAVDKKIKKFNNKSLKQIAIEAVKTTPETPQVCGVSGATVSQKIKFIPEKFKKRYLHWMENLHDWCISRQIWFGHEIPVWYKKSKVKSQKLKVNPKSEIYIGVESPSGEDWKQDQDTLDTWFSSGMWTFSTLGWPTCTKILACKPDNFQKNRKTELPTETLTKKGDLAKFHPTQMLETGYEILTLWVSRMIMMSLFAVGEIPFENVYLHGMVLDANGKKMSKSKGNGIDPLDMIEKFGTDATRLSLLMGNTPGNDMKLSEEKIAGCRNFINKFWNIARYIISQKLKVPSSVAEFSVFTAKTASAEWTLQRTDKNQKSKLEINKNLTLADQWILNKFNSLIKQVDSDLKKYNFSQAGEKLREFTWNEFADWYLEVAKFEKNQEKTEILIYILENLLKLWHPFIPFVTEIIWSNLNKSNLLMIEKWPNQLSIINYQLSIKKYAACENEFEIIKNIIITIRNARAKYKIATDKKIKAIICTKEYFDLIKNNQILIQKMRTGISELEIKKKSENIENTIKIINNNTKIYLLNAVDKDRESVRIKKEIENLKKIILNLEKKLSSQDFIRKAPKNIVDRDKKRLADLKIKLKQIDH